MYATRKVVRPDEDGCGAGMADIGDGRRPSSWQKGREWSASEVERLLNMSGTQTIPTIARQMGRSEKSVRRKLEQLGRARGVLTGFKSKDLAHDLTVSIRQIRRWRQRGYLECVSGRITEESFEKFCRNHSEKIPFRQLGQEMQLWLESFGYPTGQGFRLTELAGLLRVSPKKVRRWVAMNWLQERQKRIPEESVAKLCRLHSEVIPVERLSPEAGALLANLGVHFRQHSETSEGRVLAALAVNG
jgi:hypothetical protein